MFSRKTETFQVKLDYFLPYVYVFLYDPILLMGVRIRIFMKDIMSDKKSNKNI